MIKELTIKNYRGLDVKLAINDKFVVIGGKVGCGKSAIIDAINTLFTGYDKRGKKNSYIFANATDPKKKIVIMAVMDDERIIAREIFKDRSSIKNMVFIDGERETQLNLTSETCLFPSDFINLSGDKRAESIVEMCPEIDKLNGKSLTEELEATLDKRKRIKKEIDTLKGVIKNLSSSDSLQGTVEEAKAKKANLKDELKAAFDALSKIGEKELVNDKLKEEKEKVKEIDDKLKDLTSELSQLKAVVNNTKGLTVDKCVDSIEITEKEIFSLREKVRETHTSIAMMEKTGQCPVCGGDAEDIIELYNLKIESLNDHIAEKQELIKANLVLKKDLENKELADKLSLSIQKCESDKKGHLKKVDELTKRLTEIPVGDDEFLRKRIKGLEESLKDTEDLIERHVAIEANNKKRRETADKKIILDEKLEDIKVTIANLKEERTKSIDAGIVKIRQIFNDVSKASFDLEGYIDLTKGDKLCFEFGIVKNDKKLAYEMLSGGEKACLLVALVSSIHELNKSEFKLCTFEMSEADQNSFSKVVESCSKVNIDQCFFASCHAKEEDFENEQFIDVEEITQ